jgi:hypothetical protein
MAKKYNFCENPEDGRLLVDLGVNRRRVIK